MLKVTHTKRLHLTPPLPARTLRAPTFLQVGDPLVERREGGLHSPTLLRLIAQSGLPLFYAVHPGQHLLLQVVDFTLEQVFEAVRLHRVVASAELLPERKTLDLAQCNDC